MGKNNVEAAAKIGVDGAAQRHLTEHRGDDAAREVRARGVGEDRLAVGAQERDEHLGRRRLAVGAGNVDHLVGLLRLAQKVHEEFDALQARVDGRLRPAGVELGLHLGQDLSGRCVGGEGSMCTFTEQLAGARNWMPYEH